MPSGSSPPGSSPPGPTPGSSPPPGRDPGQWGGAPWPAGSSWADAGGHTPSEGYPAAGSGYPDSASHLAPDEGQYIDPYAPDSYGPDAFVAAGPAAPVPPSGPGGPRHARGGGPPRHGRGQAGGTGTPGNGPKVLAAVIAAAVVIAAVVIVLVVSTRSKDDASGGSTVGHRTSAPPSGGLSTSAQFTQTGSSGSSATTDPSAPPSSAGPADRQCTPDKDAMQSAIALTVTLAFIPARSTPTGYFGDVIKACTAPDLVPKITALYGKVFGIPDGGDRTGGNNTGPTAEYVFTDTDGATLTLTMSKAADGHYQATRFTIHN